MSETKERAQDEALTNPVNLVRSIAREIAAAARELSEPTLEALATRIEGKIDKVLGAIPDPVPALDQIAGKFETRIGALEDRVGAALGAIPDSVTALVALAERIEDRLGMLESNIGAALDAIPGLIEAAVASHFRRAALAFAGIPPEVAAEPMPAPADVPVPVAEALPAETPAPALLPAVRQPRKARTSSILADSEFLSQYMQDFLDALCEKDVPIITTDNLAKQLRATFDVHKTRSYDLVEHLIEGDIFDARGHDKVVVKPALWEIPLKIAGIPSEKAFAAAIKAEEARRAGAEVSPAAAADVGGSHGNGADVGAEFAASAESTGRRSRVKWTPELKQALAYGKKEGLKEKPLLEWLSRIAGQTVSGPSMYSVRNGLNKEIENGTFSTDFKVPPEWDAMIAELRKKKGISRKRTNGSAARQKFAASTTETGERPKVQWSPQLHQALAYGKGEGLKQGPLIQFLSSVAGAQMSPDYMRAQWGKLQKKIEAGQFSTDFPVPPEWVAAVAAAKGQSAATVVETAAATPG